MSEMVERVAKAIDENETFRSVIYDSGEGQSGNLEIAEEIARVAIAAMREPTEAMRQAMRNELRAIDENLGGESGPCLGIEQGSEIEAFAAAIDAALD